LLAGLVEMMLVFPLATNAVPPTSEYVVPEMMT
jgi:hypothetical protein